MDQEQNRRFQDRQPAFPLNRPQQEETAGRLPPGLEAHYRQLEQVFEHAPAGLALFDASPPYRVLAHNRAFQAALPDPWRTQGVVGRTSAGCVPPAGRADCLALLASVARTGEGKGQLFHCDDPAHAGRWWQWSLSPVVEDGEVVALVNVAVEVTGEVVARRQAVEEMEALRRLAQFPEQNPNPVLQVAADGAPLYANAAARACLAALGAPAGQPLPAAVHALVSEAFRQGHAVEAELDAENGQVFWFGALRPPGAQHVNLYARDVTARRQAEEALRHSEERFRQLADAMPQLVWTARPDGAVDYYNRRHREFLGIHPKSASGWEWVPVLHPDDRERTVKAWQRSVETGEPYQIEHRVYRADGRLRWYLSRAVPVRDEQGHIVKWYGTATDIHELREAEESLWELNQHLEQRVSERTAQAQTLAAALSQAEQQERQRVSHLLHDDLQQLLYSQLMRLELMGRLLPTAGPAALETHVADLTRLSHQALHVTRNLVSEFRPLVFDAEDLELALRWLAGRMKLAYGLEVHLDVREVCCLEDQHTLALLLQVVRELLFNAAKHAQVAEAHLAAWQDNGHIRVRVADAGQGFDVEAVRARRSAEGGMLLFSVAERLAVFGGRLEIDSAPGKGTRVTVSVPTAPADGDGVHA